MICRRCGCSRKCYWSRCDLQFEKSVQRKPVLLCAECLLNIQEGDRLPFGCLSWQNSIECTVATVLEQESIPRVAQLRGKRLAKVTALAKELERQQSYNKRREFVLRKRSIHPVNRKFLKQNFGRCTCFGMKWLQRRPNPLSNRAVSNQAEIERQYLTNEEIDILRGLDDNDQFGWSVYADWLEEQGLHGFQQIRYHLRKMTS